MRNRLLISLLTVLFSLAGQAQDGIPAPPQIEATAYILMDAASGDVLAEHNADIPLPPASLTKMMTAYVLATEMEAGRVHKDDMVVISENAWSQNPIFAGSSLMWIEPGKDVSIEDLERGIVISSGNDATVAVAEHLAGSEAVFAEMMNKQAQAIGMKDSYFVNSHGLPDPNHVVTARDLAILAQAIIAEAKAEIQADLDDAAAKADAEIAARTAESEKAIAAIRDSAVASVKEVAGDAANEIVSTMGFSADAKAVTAAVTARMKG